jgi:hypothetical protein
MKSSKIKEIKCFKCGARLANAMEYSPHITIKYECADFAKKCCNDGGG